MRMSDNRRLLGFQVVHSPNPIVINNSVPKWYIRLYWDPHTNKSKIEATPNFPMGSMGSMVWNKEYRLTFMMGID